MAPEPEAAASPAASPKVKKSGVLALLARIRTPALLVGQGGQSIGLPNGAGDPIMEPSQLARLLSHRRSSLKREHGSPRADSRPASAAAFAAQGGNSLNARPTSSSSARPTSAASSGGHPSGFECTSAPDRCSPGTGSAFRRASYHASAVSTPQAELGGRSIASDTSFSSTGSSMDDEELMGKLEDAAGNLSAALALARGGTASAANSPKGAARPGGGGGPGGASGSWSAQQQLSQRHSGSGCSSPAFKQQGGGKNTASEHRSLSEPGGLFVETNVTPHDSVASSPTSGRSLSNSLASTPTAAALRSAGNSFHTPLQSPSRMPQQSVLWTPHPGTVIQGTPGPSPLFRTGSAERGSPGRLAVLACAFSAGSPGAPASPAFSSGSGAHRLSGSGRDMSPPSGGVLLVTPSQLMVAECIVRPLLLDLITAAVGLQAWGSQPHQHHQHHQPHQHHPQPGARRSSMQVMVGNLDLLSHPAPGATGAPPAQPLAMRSQRRDSISCPVSPLLHLQHHTQGWASGMGGTADGASPALQMPLSQRSGDMSSAAAMVAAIAAASAGNTSSPSPRPQQEDRASHPYPSHVPPTSHPRPAGPVGGPSPSQQLLDYVSNAASAGGYESSSPLQNRSSRRVMPPSSSLWGAAPSAPTSPLWGVPLSPPPAAAASTAGYEPSSPQPGRSARRAMPPSSALWDAPYSPPPPSFLSSPQSHSPPLSGGAHPYSPQLQGSPPPAAGSGGPRAKRASYGAAAASRPTSMSGAARPTSMSGACPDLWDPLNSCDLPERDSPGGERLSPPMDRPSPGPARRLGGSSRLSITGDSLGDSLPSSMRRSAGGSAREDGACPPGTTDSPRSSVPVSPSIHLPAPPFTRQPTVAARADVGGGSGTSTGGGSSPPASSLQHHQQAGQCSRASPPPSPPLRPQQQQQQVPLLCPAPPSPQALARQTAQWPTPRSSCSSGTSTVFHPMPPALNTGGAAGAPAWPPPHWDSPSSSTGASATVSPRPMRRLSACDGGGAPLPAGAAAAAAVPLLPRTAASFLSAAPVRRQLAQMHEEASFRMASPRQSDSGEGLGGPGSEDQLLELEVVHQHLRGASVTLAAAVIRPPLAAVVGRRRSSVA